MLQLKDVIGKGKERTCFLHPENKTQVVKVVHTLEKKQMMRELRMYHQIESKLDNNYKHIPEYFGQVDTDQGTGYIFGKIENSDGTESKPLHWFLENGSDLNDFSDHLEELRSYFLKYSIIFCNDMSYFGNILVNEASDGTSKLIVIDGVGDVNYIQWSNKIDFFAKRKIRRRWDRLIKRLKSFEAESKVSNLE